MLTIQEITELRRNGRLDRALREADLLFAQSENKFTAAALFWCLFENFKKEHSKDRLTHLFDRMKILYESFCKDDEFIHNAFNKIEIKVKEPLFFQLRDSILRAREGNVDDDFYRNSDRMWKEGSFPKCLHLEYAWLLYYRIKSTPAFEVKERKRLLTRYLNLTTPKPSVLHSRILSEEIKTKQSQPKQFRIRDFIRLWGLENFTDQDWAQLKKDEGNIVNSTVEKLICIYAKELKTDKARSDEEFSRLVDDALIKIKNNPNLPLYKAMVLVSQGKTDEALDYYRRMISMSPTRSYLWQQAADLVEDENVKIGLLCKAISIERNEEFLGNCRLKLARLLLRKGLYPEAGRELESYRDFYLSKGWHLKLEFKQVYQSRIYVAPSNDNKSLYKNYIVYGEDFVYSGLPTFPAIKVNEKLMEDKNQKGKRHIVWTLRTKDRTLTLKKPSQFKSVKETAEKYLFNIIMVDEKIVRIKEVESVSPDVDWIKKVEGEVNLRKNANGNNYCIIKGVYVGHKLLEGVKEKQMASVLAYCQEDRWTAVSITPIFR